MKARTLKHYLMLAMEDDPEAEVVLLTIDHPRRRVALCCHGNHDRVEGRTVVLLQEGEEE